MFLILTSSDDATADYLATRATVGHSFVRMNTDTIVDHARFEYIDGGPTLTFQGEMIDPDRVSGIWYRRPKQLCTNRAMEDGHKQHFLDEWRAALESFLAHVPEEKWINHPRNNLQASHKLEQLTRAAKVGLSVPKTLVTQCGESASEFYSSVGSAIVKPISHGFIEREDPANDSLIYTNEVTVELLLNIPGGEPVYVQQKVQKKFDVRLNVIDSTIVAVQLVAHDHGEQRTDIRRNNMEDVEYREIGVPREIASLVLKMCRSYNLRFAALDFAVDHDGRWWFFEINPNGQWAWLDQLGICDFSEALIHALRFGRPNGG